MDILESILQLIIYKEIRERFKDHLWLDVVSKCDLLQSSPTILIEDEDVEVKRYKKSGPEGAIHVSVKSEIGIIEVSMNHIALIYLLHFLNFSSTPQALVMYFS